MLMLAAFKRTGLTNGHFDVGRHNLALCMGELNSRAFERFVQVKGVQLLNRTDRREDCGFLAYNHPQCPRSGSGCGRAIELFTLD